MLLKSPDYNSLTDAELICFLAADDRAAFDEIFARRWELIYKETFKRLRNYRRTEEVICMVFKDLWKNRSGLAIDDLSGYLLNCARTQIFIMYVEGRASSFFELPMDLVSSLDPGSLYKAKELILGIDQWLRTLPHQDAAVFRMKYIANLSNEEIGNSLGIPADSIHEQLLITITNLRNFARKN